MYKQKTRLYKKRLKKKVSSDLVLRVDLCNKLAELSEGIVSVECTDYKEALC
jgi:hypothetical protein